MKSLTIHTAAELQLAGEFLGRVAQGGETVILSGQLGAGKTTFAQGVARGLGVVEHVTSPTFTLIHTYVGRLTLVHCDFYRLKSPQEALEIGFLDYLRPDSLVLVEWGEGFFDVMPPHYVHITIEHWGEGRRLEAKANSEQGHQLIEKWVSLWPS